MKKLSILAIAATFASVGANAEVKPYISTSLINPFENAAIGFDLGNGVRVQGDLGYSDAKKGDAKETKTKIGLTGFYDFKNNSSVTPFVGVGLDRTSIKSENTGFHTEWIDGAEFDISNDEDTNEFGWKVQGGVAFGLAQNFNLDLSINYGSSKEKDADARKDLGLGLGARYAF